MTNTKKYHHGNLKAALFEAGLEILAESGLSGLSLRNCADRAGVSHTAPKNHFGKPVILFNYMAAAADMTGMMNGVKKARDITNSAAFKDVCLSVFINERPFPLKTASLLPRNFLPESIILLPR